MISVKFINLKLAVQNLQTLLKKQSCSPSPNDLCKYCICLILQVSLDEGTTEENFAAIKLPSSLLNNLTSEDQEIASRVQFTFYERATLFQVEFQLLFLFIFGFRVLELYSMETSYLA